VTSIPFPDVHRSHAGTNASTSFSITIPSASPYRFAFSTFSAALGAFHLGALLFQDRFARQPNAIAFNGEYLHQNLVAFFQLVANIFNAMLGNFADVQQSIGARDYLDKSSEIGQSRNRSQVSLSYLRGRGQVTNNL